MKILVGDIGGTNTRLARFDGQRVLGLVSYKNADLEDLIQAVDAYRARHGDFDVACFGIAGPVIDQAVKMTNLGWQIRRDALVRALECPVRLVNDFHAQAYAAPHLTTEQLEPLDEIPRSTVGHIALIGSGTGLGEALCIWNGTTYFPVAGEGGHSRFGPRDDRELQVLLGLRQKWPGHVSVERVASGPGILNVYDALRGDTPRHKALGMGDPSAAITGLALSKACEIAVATLEIFVDVLADESASLAMKCNASLVLVSGGIPPKILPILRERFRAAFEEKGRYRSLIEAMPVRVVVEPDFGLLGAGYAALEMI
jgi:glucokinase